MAKYGDTMGWNCDPTNANCSLAKLLGTKFIRWGPELPWYLSNSADHTSTLNLAPVAAEIAKVHSYQLGAVIAFMGTPTSLNASANTGNGGWHYFPKATGALTAAQARTAWAAKAVAFAALLNPATDYLQMNNEIANVADFNHGDQSPTEVGLALAECILAVRAAYPTLKIIMGSLNPIGDINNPATNSHSMPIWGAQMLAGAPSLLTTAAPDYWGIHTYSYGDGASDFDGSDPLAEHGWLGHVQADAYRQEIINAGIANPVMCITEMGEPSQPPGVPPAASYNEEWQNIHAQRDFAAMDVRVLLGWHGGPQIRHNLIDTSLIIDGNKKFGAFRADQTAKPLGNTIFARAQTTIGTPVGNAPAASFTAAPTADPDTWTFTDTSSGSPTSWGWDFDNDAQDESTAQNPSWTFPGAGSYPVILTATNAYGSTQSTVTITVDTIPGPSSWAYDSDILPFDWSGPLDDPFGGAVVTPPPPPFDTVVELGTVPIPGLDTGYFTLDSSRLDGSDLLGPDIVWHPLVLTVESANWHNGVDEERNRPDAGSSSVVCRAKNRNLDPAFKTGPYYPYILNRPSVRVTVDGVHKFTGTVENIKCVYDGPTAVTTFTANDGWSFLQQDVTWTPGTVERSGARINRLLDKANFRGARWVEAGEVWMQAGTEQSGSVGEQIADVIESEDGLGFFDGAGTFVFLSRLTVNGLAPVNTFTDVTGTGVQCTEAEYGSDTATWWPIAKVKGIEDKSTWATYGLADRLARSGGTAWKRELPIAFESDRYALAQHIVSLYGEFRGRFRRVRFDAASALPASDRAKLLGSPVGSAVRVKTTPPLGGSTESACIVIGETGSITHRHLDIELATQEGRDIHYFTLDDPTYGLLDGTAILAP